MKANISWRTMLVRILAVAAVFIALAGARAAYADGQHEHLVTDWSHRHALYAAPKTLLKQFQLSGDRRFVDQWRRREADQRHHDRDEWRWHHAPQGPGAIHGDWSVNMGAGATVGPANYPAKFSFDTTSANCATDFVAYNTSVAGSASQATIVAFSNLYSSCGGTVPGTYWAYNTGTGSSVVTSPVLSPDGSQVAFIQNNGTAATLVVLRWKAGTGALGAPATPATGACTALTAPCMTTVAFSTANGDTTTADSFASPYVDYGHDTLYVGDNFGFLHKFTGVFQGIPTEVVSSVTNLWPANLDSPFGHLNSSVYDPNLNKIYVTDSNGFLYQVDATVGGVPSSGYVFSFKLAGDGFDDGPIVDMTNETAYVFARGDNAADVAGIFQFNLPFTQSAPGTEIVTSNSATKPTAFHLGAFDNQYYITGGTGYLYVCATAGTANALWQVHIDTTLGVTTLDTASLGPTLTSAVAPCSPITEFFDGTTDRMFVSVGNNALNGGTINCPSTGGCLMSFSTAAAFPTTLAPLAVATEAGGTSGIVIDNAGTGVVGATQVYFTPLADQACTTSGGTGGCAIQASQSALN